MIGRKLAARDFVRIADAGFGDPHNSRAQSLAWFRDRLFVGVTRHPPRRGDDGPELGRWSPDIRITSRTARGRYVDQRGEIWRYDPDTDEWEQALVSPLVELPGEGRVPRDAGYRRMVVFQGSSDPAPALYVSSLSIGGIQILRSTDGRRFTPVPRPGPGAENAWSFRTFAVFDRRLHTSPAGRIDGEFIERNDADASLVYSSADPAGGRWRVDNKPGFGDPGNLGIYELATFRDDLYAATTNSCSGFQIWRTDVEGHRYRWRRVLSEGATRGVANEGVPTMCAFRDALYVGTGRQGGGAGTPLRGACRGAELIRLRPEGHWDLVVGEPRNTHQGSKTPLSGMGPGFDNPTNTQILELVEHDGWLYAGTGNTGSVPLMLLQRHCRRRMRRRVDVALAQRGGFELWRSRDGVDWETVTDVGFGSVGSNSAASMLSTPPGLVIGTGTLPGAAAIDGASGCEIWLGRRRETSPRTAAPLPGRR